jgi:hypothetical protein
MYRLPFSLARSDVRDRVECQRMARRCLARSRGAERTHGAVNLPVCINMEEVRLADESHQRDLRRFDTRRQLAGPYNLRAQQGLYLVQDNLRPEALDVQLEISQI